MLGLGLDLIFEEDFDLLRLSLDLLQFEEDFDLLEISRILDFLPSCGFSPGLASGLLDYSRPNSVYRALCKVWCLDTNTFITNGENGISLWNIREITGLSIRGDYYEEVVPSLLELLNLLPQSCSYLFKAYSLIVDKKKIDRIHHANWIQFWFQEDDCVPNPRKSKPFKKVMESKPLKEGQLIVKDRIRRPVVTDRSKEILRRDRSHWNSSLSVDEKEELEIEAYLFLWLCRFIFPYRDDYSELGLSKQLLEWLPSRLTV
ncbi:Uncharacterized protein Adt_41604 [Abeliophyllum distichum]|uniref:Aminotransferase-like plant mobile domain-containing protein n=1 Tax=Abeliophyllum distichum TaxID=126358 RepID=A0ABD1PPB0_9LAMI